MQSDLDWDDSLTLDPPGTIAVVGAGPLGLEAALYGRFLGYDVTVFEQGKVAESLRGCGERPLPMLPSHCLSPLAANALKAQFGEDACGGQQPLPMTIDQWVRDGLERLAETDLLRGRVHTQCQVIRIEQVETQTETDTASNEPADAEPHPAFTSIDAPPEESEDVGDIPPDFRLTWLRRPAPEAALVVESSEFESVIWATGTVTMDGVSGLKNLATAPYFFRIGVAQSITSSRSDDTTASQFQAGLRDIVSVFATLGGRQGLDLYRPLRT